MPLPPENNEITLTELTHDPYPIYKRLRAEMPVASVGAAKRILLTKASDTRAVKDNPDLWSSNDPDTPMKRAFQAHTLMRKDGEEHRREREAMMPTFSPKNLRTIWAPAYENYVSEYLDRLPTSGVVDLFPTLAGPIAARILADVLGIPEASDEDMQHWSQSLIDGAGNFGWDPAIFEGVDKAHVAMNTTIERHAEQLRDTDDQSALAVMINAENPIAWGQILANLKIAIGGGINEPRDALLTILFGLLTNPEQLEEIKATNNWGAAFEEGVRWVAPIQVSSRKAMQDTQIRGFDIPKDSVVMTVQASANHDEDVLEDGHLYNALRPTIPHQSFGSGAHHCMGTHLARRLVGKIMLPMLFERFPNIQLADPDEVVFRGFGFRGPIRCPVRLT